MTCDTSGSSVFEPLPWPGVDELNAGCPVGADINGIPGVACAESCDRLFPSGRTVLNGGVWKTSSPCTGGNFTFTFTSFPELLNTLVDALEMFVLESAVGVEDAELGRTRGVDGMFAENENG